MASKYPNKKESRPLVRCPEEWVGTFKGCDLLLKSNNPVEDAHNFDALVKEFKEWYAAKESE